MYPAEPGRSPHSLPQRPSTSARNRDSVSRAAEGWRSGGAWVVRRAHQEQDVGEARQVPQEWNDLARFSRPHLNANDEKLTGSGRHKAYRLSAPASGQRTGQRVRTRLLQRGVLKSRYTSHAQDYKPRMSLLPRMPSIAISPSAENRVSDLSGTREEFPAAALMDLLRAVTAEDMAAASRRLLIEWLNASDVELCWRLSEPSPPAGTPFPPLQRLAMRALESGEQVVELTAATAQHKALIGVGGSAARARADYRCAGLRIASGSVVRPPAAGTLRPGSAVHGTAPA